MAGFVNRVAFDAEVRTKDEYGGAIIEWTPVTPPLSAEFRYERGREAEQAGAQTGTASFKVRLRSNPTTRALTPAHRMRDVLRGVAYNVREVDPISDRAFVWIVAESGVAI